MLTGAAPFSGTAAQVVTAHLTTPAQPITERRSDIPPALADLVMRALEKDPGRRPQSAGEMLAALDALAPSRATTPAIGGAPASPSMLKRIGVPVVALSVVAAASFGAWRFMRPTIPVSAQSIAIVPFSVADGDTALVRLSQNLVTLLSNNLDGVGEIRVADPMSVVSHVRSVGHALTSLDAMAIARALRASSAVYGTLVREGAEVRIDVGLYDVSAPGTPMARVSVSAPSDSVAALTDSLTMGLLRKVWSKGTPPTPHVASITTHSPVALREFLDGERRFMHGDIHAAGDSYKRAVEADTTFWFAAYRYGLARSWLAEDAEDPSIQRRLRRHRADLPERERALLATGDSSPTQSERLRRLAAVTARYPDYAPAWEDMADRLTHNFMRSGHGVAQAVEPWRRVVALMPADLTAANHLVIVCILAGDLPGARDAFTRFDSLVRADPAVAKPEIMAQRMLALVLEPTTRARLDSILLAAVRDSALATITPSSVVYFAPALVEHPEFLSNMEMINSRVIAAPAAPAIVRRTFQTGTFLTRATRGDWAALDSADIVLASGPLFPGPSFSRMEVLRARVLAELQGAVVASKTTGEALARRIADGNLRRDELVELQWESSVNALLRGDSSALRNQLAVLAKDTSVTARVAVRSMRALEMGLGGKRAVAAESLLVLERDQGENGVKVWGAFAGDRLLGAQWLTELGKPAQADSLLEFTRGFLIGPTLEVAWPVFGAAQLQRSRIAEALGRRDDAIRFATIFTRAYDLDPAAHKAQMDEARRRIERLGGDSDAVKPRKLP
jgi:TolB-like protein